MISTDSWAPASMVGAILSPVTVSSLAVMWLGYRLLLVLYNLSPLHPLYRFPGPRLAAASYLYEAYYDWLLVGRYTVAIKQMHERYGPIVRISPDELHCADPAFTDEIYAGPGRIRDRWIHHLNAVNGGTAVYAAFATVHHELHRTRRAPLARFFSRGQIVKLESEVLELAQMTVDKILCHAGGEPFKFQHAMQCFTADIISQYSFGKPMGFIAQDGWEPNFATWVHSFQRLSHTMRHITPARKASQYMPGLANYLGKDMRLLMHQMNVVIPSYIRDAVADPDNTRLFAELARNKMLPAEGTEAMTETRLNSEAFILLTAGTETTATTITYIAYRLLAHPHLLDRLRRDLGGLAPETLRWAELERRSYLWAVVQEGLRWAPGVSHRSARIARAEDLVYKGRDGSAELVIPRGTPVGMSPMISHWDAGLFPEPDRFAPERWLLDDGEGGLSPNYELQKKLISFSKGSRACLGENLALCEIYIMTALLALRVLPRARLVDTTLESVTYHHDEIGLQSKTGPICVKVAIS